MISLDNIKESLARLEENDGKLLAALNELPSNEMYDTLRMNIGVISDKLDTIGGVLAELLAHKPPRKKARRKK